MPKYVPTREDVYEITPCIICGKDTMDKNKDTCCWECKYEKEYYEEWYKEDILSYMDEE